MHIEGKILVLIDVHLNYQTLIPICSMLTREELEEKLIDFDGALLFVSHDRYFLNKIASKVWELTPNGLFKIEGNYDDYCAYKGTQEKEHILKR